MPETPNLKLPWPDYSSPVQIPDDIRLLAQALDTTLKPVVDRRVPQFAQGIGQITLNKETYKSVVVQLPVGRFTVAPIVVVSAMNSGLIFGNGAPTLTQFGVFVRDYEARSLTGTYKFSWIAIGG